MFVYAGAVEFVLEAGAVAGVVEAGAVVVVAFAAGVLAGLSLRESSESNS